MNRLLNRLLCLIFVIVCLSMGLLPVRAQTSSGACAITPDKIDGQGLNVSGLGLNVSGLGLNVSGLGLNVSGLGLNVSGLGLNVSGLSLEQIVKDIWTNPVTPAWLTQLLPGVEGGTGYNTVPAAILIVDDFSTATSHGYDVRKVFDDLVSAINAARDPDPIITLVNVDISGANYDSMLIANRIRSTVDSLLPTHQHFAVNMSFGLVPCEDPVGTTITDSETGQTFTLNKPFDFDQMRTTIASAPAVTNGAVVPIFECLVQSSHGKFIAYYGYHNYNTVSVTIPVSHKNKFYPEPYGRGQPTVFMPGRQSFVFKVEFKGKAPDWKLQGPDNKLRIASIPNHGNTRCQGTPTLRTIQAGLNGYGGLTQFAQTTLGVPDKFVDDYLEYLQAKGPTVDDPLNGLRPLLQGYLNRSAYEAADGNPSTRFALIPVASAGNFRPILGATPLAPARFPETIAVSATLGTFGDLWVMSHDGNVRAPGAGYVLAKDSSGGVTRVGAGTSFAAPYVTTLAALWLTYPNACQFTGGRVPLITEPSAKNTNTIAGISGNSTSPLACSKNNPPVLGLSNPITINEGASISIGTVSDPEGSAVTVTSSLSGSSVVNNSGTLIFTHNDGPVVNQIVTITAMDAQGAQSTATFTLNVDNVAPTATLTANLLTINAGQSITLSLISPYDPGAVDTTTGFNYAFDCGIGGGVVSTGTTASFSCTYPTAGSFTALGKIRDKDGGIGESTLAIVVNPVVTPSTCYAVSVTSYVKGKRKDNGSIATSRTDPTKALGAPQRNDTENFVSLGFGNGTTTALLVLDFYPNTIQNKEGLDLRVWETSFKDGSQSWSRYPEAVKVYASQDSESWVQIGMTSDKDQAYDLGSLPWARYIKLVDVSNRSKFSNSDDGFDVDGVEAFACLPVPTETPLAAMSVPVVETEVTPVATEVTPVATVVTPIPTEVTPVATEVTPVPTEVTPVPTEVTPVPTEVTPIPTEVTPVDPCTLDTVDTDGDGISNTCDTDDDGDTLLDTDEATLYLTNPLVADTDGDGITDGAEVSGGTNPLEVNVSGS